MNAHKRKESEKELKKLIGPILCADFKSQNVGRLYSWFNRNADAIDILTDELRESPLKYALRENMWLSSAFLLRQPRIPNKPQQVQSAMDNPHQACPLLLRAHIQSNPKAQVELLSFLHDRVRL
jgi:hypothetical protein